MAEFTQDELLTDSLFDGVHSDTGNCDDDSLYITGDHFTLMTDFETDALEKRQKEASDDEKLKVIFDIINTLPIDERQRMFRRLKNEIGRLSQPK